jgi:hypothetical protein
MAAAINFISKDGFLNVEEFVLLAREIDKIATKEGLKPAEIHYAGKVIPKYDLTKAKAGGEAFTKKRAQLVKVRARMPASGSRVKMVVLLRNYKGIEEYTEFTKDFAAAVKAIATHNKLAERVIVTNKKEGAKKRDVANAAFDKNVDAFLELMSDAGVSEDEVAIGMSMMGKTIIVKLPNGGYVSVGKADKERFLKAKESGDAPAAKKPVGRAAKAPVKTTRAAKAAPAPVKATRGRKVVEEAPVRRTKKVAAAPAKVVKKPSAVSRKPAVAAKPARTVRR